LRDNESQSAGAKPAESCGLDQGAGDQLKTKVLVTGIAGFIGSHVARECVRQGFDVVGIDDLSGGFLENVPAGSRFVQGSVTSDALIGNLFDVERFDYVFHLAAYAAEGLSHFIRRFNYETNLGGSMNIVNACVRHDVKCLVFSSSIAVYGRNQLPMIEELTPQPEDPYGVSKYAVELDLHAAREMFGLNYVVFRPHNVYGEQQNIADKYRNVIGIFMNLVLQGKAMTIFGDGQQTRAFTYVGDVTAPIVESVQMPECYGQVFNIGADQSYSVLQLAQQVAKALGVELSVQHLPPRNEVEHAYASHAKLEKFFGPQPRTSLEEGLGRMAAWVRQVGVREPVRFQNIEITKNLPASWAS
jgi:UDP-glucose 4-epimerase